MTVFNIAILLNAFAQFFNALAKLIAALSRRRRRRR